MMAEHLSMTLPLSTNDRCGTRLCFRRAQTNLCGGQTVMNFNQNPQYSPHNADRVNESIAGLGGG